MGFNSGFKGLNLKSCLDVNRCDVKLCFAVWIQGSTGSGLPSGGLMTMFSQIALTLWRRSIPLNLVLTTFGRKMAAFTAVGLTLKWRRRGTPKSISPSLVSTVSVFTRHSYESGALTVLALLTKHSNSDMFCGTFMNCLSVLGLLRMCMHMSALLSQRK